MQLSLADQALLELLQSLDARDYSFITPTPLTHARVVARAGREQARTLRDIFGWSLSFTRIDLDSALFDLLQRAGAVQSDGARYRSLLRVSRLHSCLYLHSAYPTRAADAVFFGPDTYRFADFVSAELPASATSLRCVDIGCGSGAGAISAAVRLPAAHWTLTDINPAALRLASINAEHAGRAMDCVRSDVLAEPRGDFDLIISNPPYIADAQRREYRDGGAGLGRALSLRIVHEALPRLNHGGRLLLYTGIAMVDGIDPFQAELQPLLGSGDYRWHYRELDPDVFGEELEQPAYLQAERIAAVGLVVTRL